MKTIKLLIEVLIVICIILCGLWLRFLILKIPLNVDEGYWAYTASMMIQGQNLFTDIWSTNPLFVYIPYILSEKFLGHGLSNLRLLGVSVNILTIGMIFLLARKSFGKWVGIVSLLFASVFAVAFQQEGHFILNGEHISQLPLFLSLFLMVYGFEGKGRFRNILFFLSGFFMGYVWQVREHYVLLHVFLFIYLLLGMFRNKILRKDLLYYIFGSVLPLLFIAVYLLISGNFIEYIKGVYYYRYLYMNSAQSVVFDSRFFYIVNDRMGHLLWILVLTVMGFVFIVREKLKYKKFWAVLVFISGIIILLSTGNRLFNHYFLYLTYGSLILASYGLIIFIKHLKSNYPILVIPAIVAVMIFSFRQFDLNRQYLLNFNKPVWGLPYKNLIFDRDMISYLNTKKSGERTLFMGESTPYYYYINRDMKEKYPIPGFFIYEPYKTFLWKEWFENFRNNPPEVIVEDFGIEDMMMILEFKDYVNQNYAFDLKINQHYIFRLKENRIVDKK